MDTEHQLTRILHEIGQGDPHAYHRLIPLVHDELRALAAWHMRREPDDHTLQPTALVNEAYLKLVEHDLPLQWHDRQHFLAVAARVMRQILVDHFRAKSTGKRKTLGERVPLEGLVLHASIPSADLLDLDDALTRLAEVHPRAAEVVQLRVFGGMTVDEVAAHFEITPRAVAKHWAAAQAWLLRELKGAAGESETR